MSGGGVMVKELCFHREITALKAAQMGSVPLDYVPGRLWCRVTKKNGGTIYGLIAEGWPDHDAIFITWNFEEHGALPKVWGGHDCYRRPISVHDIRFFGSTTCKCQ